MAIRRRSYALVTALLVPLGFSTKWYRGAGAQWIHDYAGDILYPMFWFFVVLFLFPRLRPLAAAAAVFLFSTAVEFTQLFSWPALIYLRASFLGRTLVGNSFSLVDILYYFIGSASALAVHFLLNLLFLPAAAHEPKRHHDPLESGGNPDRPPNT